jgi:hypothetical protein
MLFAEKQAGHGNESTQSDLVARSEHIQFTPAEHPAPSAVSPAFALPTHAVPQNRSYIRQMDILVTPLL